MLKSTARAILNGLLNQPSLARLLRGSLGKAGAYVNARVPAPAGSGPRDPHETLFAKYEAITRIPREIYCDNLGLAATCRDIPGAVVECGVWRGGMIAGIAEILGSQRDYYLYDSFEGLPPVQDIDGAKALAWQDANNVANCRTDESYARRAMEGAGASRTHLIKGWFDKTISAHPPSGPVALLRLDGDWYSSTATCLNELYPRVVKGGLIVVDDYIAWDGCSRAIHDYLSANNLEDRIEYWNNHVCYFRKRSDKPVRAIPENRSLE